MRTKYVSLDIETTGLNPDGCQILSIGAVCDHIGSFIPIKGLPKYHVYVRNESGTIRGEYCGIEMNSEIITIICGKKWSPEIAPVLLEQDVASDFSEWLIKGCGYKKGDAVVFAGKNFSSFDRRFLELLPGWKGRVLASHRSIDPGELLWCPEVDGSELPNFKKCLKRVVRNDRVCLLHDKPEGFASSTECVHDALQDAADVVLMIRKHQKSPWVLL